MARMMAVGVAEVEAAVDRHKMDGTTEPGDSYAVPITYGNFDMVKI